MVSTFESLGVLAALVLFLCYNRWRATPKPPGPRGLPILGNLFDVPKGKEWEAFAEMGRVYGPLSSLTVGPTTIVVVNSHKKAVELLVQKSSIFSSRPFLGMTGEMMGHARAAGLIPYGHELRQMRKMYYQDFGTASAVKGMWPQVQALSHKLVTSLLERPHDFLDIAFRHAGALTIKASYGYDLPSHGKDKLFDLGWECVESANQSFHYWANKLPFLRHVPDWFPGAHFKQQAKAWFQLHEDFVNESLDYVRQEMAAGTAPESYVSRRLGKNLSLQDYDILRYGASAIFIGGIETTGATLQAFFCLMTAYPEVQRRAQAEILSVCGPDRLPTIEDRPSMPYTNALLLEIFRFYPPTPCGVPHSSTADDVHDGYYIPKGSIVITNAWQMSRDEDVYSNPNKFDPTRFLGKNPEQSPHEWSFGFGRRGCSGLLLADTFLWSSFTTCLAAFNMEPVRDQNGAPVYPELEYKPALICPPKPFTCNIVPRLPRAQLEELLLTTDPTL